jgi:hypothetical protein
MRDPGPICRAAPCALALLATLTLACRQSAGSGDRPRDGAPVSVGTVKDNADDFVGQRLRLSGAVGAVFSDRAFELESRDWLLKDRLTVLTRTRVRFGAEPLRAGEAVVVTGTVRRFSRGHIERELGWDLGGDAENRLRGRLVVIADQISRTDTTASWSAHAR